MTLYNANGDAMLVYNAAVIGTVVSAPGNEIPEGAIVTVQLNDVSLMDVAATNISEEVITGVTGFPFPFVLTYDPRLIDQPTYAVQVRITDSTGQLIYINTSAYNVITGGAPSVVEVQVDPV
jgi:putative lipoprotein